MKLLKQVLVSILCLVVLVSAATASTGLKPVKLTKEQARNFYRNKLASAPRTATPVRSSYRQPRNSVSFLPPAIATSSKYKAIQLLSEFSAYGLGIGTLGDYALLPNPDGLFGLRNGELKYIDSPYDLSGGRMWGNFYFGDEYGNIFRLEPDLRTVTPVWTEWDEPGLTVGGLDVDHVTGDVFFALMVDFGYQYIDFYRLHPSTGDIDYFGNIDSPYCYGLAVKGNRMYMSLWWDDVILWWDWVHGGGVYVFTDKVYGPGDIIFDAAGNLFALEHDGGTVLKFNSTATIRSKIAWNIPGPTHIGLDKFGDVFFSDYYGELWKLKKK